MSKNKATADLAADIGRVGFTNHSVAVFVMRSMIAYYGSIGRLKELPISREISCMIEEKRFPFDRRTVRWVKKWGKATRFSRDFHGRFARWFRPLFLKNVRSYNVHSPVHIRNLDKYERFEDSRDVELLRFSAFIAVYKNPANLVKTFKLRSHGSVFSDYVNSRDGIPDSMMELYENGVLYQSPRDAIARGLFWYGYGIIESLRGLDVGVDIDLSSSFVYNKALVSNITFKALKSMKVNGLDDHPVLGFYIGNERFFEIGKLRGHDVYFVFSLDGELKQVVQTSPGAVSAFNENAGSKGPVSSFERPSDDEIGRFLELMSAIVDKTGKDSPRFVKNSAKGVCEVLRRDFGQGDRELFRKSVFSPFKFGEYRFNKGFKAAIKGCLDWP